MAKTTAKTTGKTGKTGAVPKCGRRRSLAAALAALAVRGRIIALASVTPLPATARAQSSWPSKPVRVIVPYPAGGNADAIGRFVADRLGAALGQPMVVENKAGAGASIGTELAAQAAADGYTLLVAPNAVFTITHHLRGVSYDPERDFVPIARVSGSYSIVAARRDAPFGSLRELARLAREAPGRYTFGSAGLATATHLAGEMVSHAAGFRLLHVPYKGSAEALADLVGGRIDLLFDPVSLAQVQAGTVKAIAVLSRNRHPELPDVPTVAEQGFEVDSRSWFALFAPKGTAATVVDRLAIEMKLIVEAPETRALLLRFSQYPDYLGPTPFAEQIRADSAFFKELIRAADIRIN